MSTQSKMPPARASETETLTVMLVDGETLVRSSLAHLLQVQDGIEVVAEAAADDPQQASLVAQGHRPDVILYDPQQARSAEEAIEQIKKLSEASPQSSILVLTSRQDASFARDTIRAGAGGYLLMSESPEELLKAIRRASRGKPSISPRIAVLIAGLDQKAAGEDLTARELSVVKLAALGYTNKEIAEQLHLSIRTVESHRASIIRKLDLGSRAGLVRYALDNGLIEPL